MYGESGLSLRKSHSVKMKVTGLEPVLLVVEDTDPAGDTALDRPGSQFGFSMSGSLIRVFLVWLGAEVDKVSEDMDRLRLRTLARSPETVGALSWP